MFRLIVRLSKERIKPAAIDSQPYSCVHTAGIAIFFIVFVYFFPYPSVVNRHSLLLLVRVKLGVEIDIRAEGPASSAGFVAMSPCSILKPRARVCR